MTGECRKYLLDLVRFSPRDCNVSSTEPNSPLNRLAILRPELVSRFAEEERVVRYMKAKGLDARPSAEAISEAQSNGEMERVLFNVNVLTEFSLSEDEGKVKEEEEVVKRAGAYLMETALPEAVKALRSFKERPMDGQVRGRQYCVLWFTVLSCVIYNTVLCCLSIVCSTALWYTSQWS